ncbi:MAG: hypothetical protein ACD_74C00008G0002 [uncultured bacterium]|nr:MAG: hypothetical protein ACD_74C00008G0002 [uncultured bacterium]
MKSWATPLVNRPTASSFWDCSNWACSLFSSLTLRKMQRVTWGLPFSYLQLAAPWIMIFSPFFATKDVSILSTRPSSRTR